MRQYWSPLIKILPPENSLLYKKRLQSHVFRDLSNLFSIYVPKPTQHRSKILEDAENSVFREFFMQACLKINRVGSGEITYFRKPR